jgi:hypothetical protein
VPNLPLKLVIIDESIVLFGMEDPVADAVLPEFHARIAPLLVLSRTQLTGRLRIATTSFASRSLFVIAEPAVCGSHDLDRH